MAGSTENRYIAPIISEKYGYDNGCGYSVPKGKKTLFIILDLENKGYIEMAVENGEEYFDKGILQKAKAKMIKYIDKKKVIKQGSAFPKQLSIIAVKCGINIDHIIRILVFPTVGSRVVDPTMSAFLRDQYTLSEKFKAKHRKIRNYKSMNQTLQVIKE